MTPEGLLFCLAVLVLGGAAASATFVAEAHTEAPRRAHSTLPDFVNGDQK